MKKRFVPIWMMVILASCTTRQVEPTRVSRRTIDTTFQKQVLLLQPQYDSVCLSMMDSLFMHAVDSMMAERQAEMNQLVQ